MSQTFIARPRTTRPVRHVTGRTWMVTYKGESLGLFTPSPTQSVKTMLADMGIDINNTHVEPAGYIYK